MESTEQIDRRSFLRTSAGAACGLTAATLLPAGNTLAAGNATYDRPNVIGPREGFSPQIGTLVSMFTLTGVLYLTTKTGALPYDLFP